MSSAAELADVHPSICAIPSREAFDGLGEEDRLYAHFMCRAAFLGTRIVLRQTSAESEKIYDLLLDLYSAVDGDWKSLLTKQQLGKDDLDNFLDFAAMFFANLGNYRSQGDTKFIPRINRITFEQLSRCTPSTHSKFLEVADQLYSTVPNHLGYPDDEAAASGYYLGASITKEEIAAVQHAMQERDMLPENTRIQKVSVAGDDDDIAQFNLLLASSRTSGGPVVDPITLQLPGNPTMQVLEGDYNSVLGSIVSELESAKQHTDEHLRKEVIGYIIEAFSSGEHRRFKEAQKSWVKDINPNVEVVLGFIETYQDPYGIRGAFEGIVAVVNKPQSERFAALVENSSRFIATLPWNGSKVGLLSDQKSAFEPANFIKPDFTSLDTIGFVKSESPAGINLPNFEDICQQFGSKNLEFGNVNNANPADDEIPFIQPHEIDFIHDLREKAFEVTVACHELLGHGSGQLFVESAPGVYNFDIKIPPQNPVNKQPISSWYKPGETWSNVFGTDANAIEECRADGVALILMAQKPVLEIFGYNNETKPTADDVMYAGWLYFIYGAVKGLASWNPQTSRWGQSHRRGTFALMNCMMRADESFLRIERSEDALKIVMDRNKILSHGLPSIEKFLLHLQVYKSTANAREGIPYFSQFTELDWEFEKCREIVLQKVPARIQYVQANTFLEHDRVQLREYPPTREGLIQSWAERHV